MDIVNDYKTKKRGKDMNTKKIDKGICPNCGMRTYFIVFFDKIYGWDKTCIKCGFRFFDENGFRTVLPSHRENQLYNIQIAKMRWKIKC